MTNIRKCPFCNSVPKLYFKRKDNIGTLKCKKCGLIYPDQITDYMLSETYDNELEYFEKSNYDGIGYESYCKTPIDEFVWQKAIIDLFNQFENPKVLDVGCATGNFLQLCKNDYDCLGIDISSKAVGTAKKRGLNAQVKDINGIDSKFDIITVWETMDHIIDIKKFFEKIKLLLNKDGIFIFSTPDAGIECAKSENWSGFDQSFEHVNYFTKESLSFMFTKVFGKRPIIFTLENPYKEDYPLLFGYVKKGTLNTADKKIQNLSKTSYSKDSILKLKNKISSIIILLLRRKDLKWLEYVNDFFDSENENSLTKVIFQNYFYNKEGFIRELNENLQEKSSKIEEFSDTINQQTSEIKEKDSKIEEFSDTINQQTSEIKEKSSKIEEFSDTINQQTSEIKEKSSKIKEFSDTINQQTSEIKEKSSKIEEFSDTINQQTSEIKEKDSKIKEFSDTINQQTSEIKEKDSKIKEFSDTINQQTSEIKEKSSKIEEFSDTINQQTSELHANHDTIHKLEKQITTNESYIEDKEVYIAQLKEYINDKELYITFLKKFAEKSLYWRLSKISNKLKSKIIYIGNKIIVNNFIFNDPYSRVTFLKNIPINSYDDKTSNKAIPFSAISTLMSEEKTIELWLNTIENQNKKPDEFIIVDGGSTDQTIPKIESYIKNSKINFKLIKREKAGISEGRNIAIEHASNEIIVSVDGGSKLDPHYFENIVKPFEIDEKVDLVGGIYESKNEHFIEKLFHRYFIPDWDNLNLNNFLPSARCVAYRKSLWKKIGKHPTWLKTGDDTLFDIEYRKVSRKWAFSKNAKVYWEFPTSVKKCLNIAYRYGFGDGQSGLGDFFFYQLMKFFQLMKKTKNPIKLLVMLLGLASLAKSNGFFYPLVRYSLIKGYKHGRQKRVEKILEKYKTIPYNVLILSGVPLSDIGGGQRGTQLALELLKNNCKVTFVNYYPSSEENKKIFFDADFSLLELEYFPFFDIEEFVCRNEKLLDRTMVVLEFPMPQFIPIIDRLQKLDVQVIYDCIDNWDTDLGWVWYDRNKELEIAEKSDKLVATAKPLRQKLQKMCPYKQIQLVPNAVNLNLFQYSDDFKRPIDLPSTKKIITYIGSLYGNWFDWDLIKKLSENFKDSTIILIGNYDGQCPHNDIKNVHFLGLKQQWELPAYLYFSDVCIIPFKINKLVDAINPLKAYEYLAMRKPIVTTNMSELVDFPYTLLSQTHDEFIKNINKSFTITVDVKVIEEFLENNSWKNRVFEMFPNLKSLLNDILL